MNSLLEPTQISIGSQLRFSLVDVQLYGNDLKPMSEERTEPQQPLTFAGRFKESMRRVGHAIDSGASSLMKETGQTVRATCPKCSSLMLAPPNEFVKCPTCTHEFNSPTFSERTAAVSKDISRDMKDTWGSKTSSEETNRPSGA